MAEVFNRKGMTRVPTMQDKTIHDWLEALAAKEPVPGGGTVAALAAAVSAAQLSMVANYTTGSKWQDREQHMKELIAELSELRNDAFALAEADATAFEKVAQAYTLPKNSKAEKTARSTAIQQALIGASEPPAQTIKLAGRLSEVAEELAKQGNPNVLSDVAVGASLARAALESAIVNIEINAHGLKDTRIKRELLSIVEDATDFIQDTEVTIETVRDQLGSA